MVAETFEYVVYPGLDDPVRCCDVHRDVGDVAASLQLESEKTLIL